MNIASSRLSRAAIAGALAALALAACSGHRKDATQSAARVDGTEITVHQINYRLQREKLTPDQMDAASHKALEQLIDEQLLVEKAEKTKVDDEPGAQQAMAAARREVLARAYVEQAAQSVPAPTEQQLHAYFDGNDALFSQRRVYTLQEYLARVPVDKVPALTALVEGGRTSADVEAWFKAQGVPYREQESTHPAEQIPLNSLKRLATVQDGRGLVVSAGEQVHVTYVASSVAAPVTFEKARAAIAQFLTGEARRQATAGNLEVLRSVAQLTYAAPYQSLASSGPAFSLKDVEAASQAAASGAARVSLPGAAAPGVTVSLPAADASSAVRVSLPASDGPGVRVSLPAVPASGAEVRLPAQTPIDSGKK